MSFICKGCGNYQPNGERPKKVLLSVMERPTEVHIQGKRGPQDLRFFRKGSPSRGAVCGGEVLMCSSCATKASKVPEVVERREDPLRHIIHHDPSFTRDRETAYA